MVMLDIIHARMVKTKDMLWMYKRNEEYISENPTWIYACLSGNYFISYDNIYMYEKV